MSNPIVLAALDNSLADRPVLNAARALAWALDASVEAIHVCVDGARVASAEAEAADVPLVLLHGEVVERLLEQGERDEVLALVVGARRTPGGRTPLGSTALAVATTMRKPVLVVPPDATPADQFDRVLVPVEGRMSEQLTPREIVKVAGGASLDVVVLHVHEPETLPSFTDQPQHEQPEWAHEFLRRYCPWGIDHAELEVRTGRTEDLLPQVAEQRDVDLIALGWAQELAEGRAPVVRAALARARVPVLLVPVSTPARRADEPVAVSAA